jgi:hypothetical protein
MIGFSDHQMELIMVAAQHLRLEDRGAFLELIASQLKPKTIDVDDAVKRALRFFEERGLVTCSDRCDDG